VRRVDQAGAGAGVGAHGLEVEAHCTNVASELAFHVLR
jgi:hypothetical protein